MRKLARRPLVALATFLVLCVAASAASASRGIGTNTGGRAVTFTTERLVFASEFSSVSCPVTLTGTFSSGFEKLETVHLAEITGASLPERSCTGGTVRLLTETLPWELGYYSFSGTLPRITGLTLGIEELSALVESIGIGCLYTGIPRGLTSTGTEVTTIRLDETVRIPIARALSAFCPTEGTVSGTFRISPTIRLTLLESLPAGSSLSPNVNPLAIPQGNPNGVIVLTAVSGTVNTGRPRAKINPEWPPFTAVGCEDARITMGNSCNVLVTKTGRPGVGKVRMFYRNDQGDGYTLNIAVNLG
jgi:hypothetical protein